MTAMRPAPRRVRQPAVEAEAEVLDDVIQRIDQALPNIHRMASAAESPNRLSKAQFARAKIVFQDMKDDPLLNEKGDDICLESKKKKKKKTIHRASGIKINGHINGQHPQKGA